MVGHGRTEGRGSSRILRMHLSFIVLRVIDAERRFGAECSHAAWRLGRVALVAGALLNVKLNSSQSESDRNEIQLYICHTVRRIIGAGTVGCECVRRFV